MTLDPVKTWVPSTRVYRRGDEAREGGLVGYAERSKAHRAEQGIEPTEWYIDYTMRCYVVDRDAVYMQTHSPQHKIAGWAIYGETALTQQQAADLMRDRLHPRCTGFEAHRPMVLRDSGDGGYRWVCMDCHNSTQRARRAGVSGVATYKTPIKVGQWTYGILEGTISILGEDAKLYDKAAADAALLSKLAPMMSQEAAEAIGRVVAFITGTDG